MARLLLRKEEEEAGLELLRLTDERSGSLEGRLFDLHLGNAASPECFSEDLRGYSVLHFAAHGVVDREDPRNTSLVLTTGQEQSGSVTLADVLELDLDANLVVLSACDTARGEVRQGEGVQSMAWAFLYAGARSVVASLWQVDDDRAAQTMQAFYQRLLVPGQPVPQALREAKLEVRRSPTTRGAGSVGAEGSQRGLPPEAGHPYYWAPFVQIGLPR